jgi:hypothetical protein
MNRLVPLACLLTVTAAHAAEPLRIIGVRDGKPAVIATE